MLKEHKSYNIVRTAVIGLGNVGLLYDLKKKTIHTHCEAVHKNPKFHLECGIDVNRGRRKIFNKKYHKPSYENYKSASLNHKIDFLILSANTKLQFKIFKEIIEKNTPKFILLEKPGGKNFNELKNIFRICEKKNIRIFVNYNRDYINEFNKLKINIKKLDYTKIVFWYSRGLYNNCSHLLNFIVGLYGKPKKITFLQKYKNFSNEVDFDFKLNYLNSEVYFFCTPLKNISHNEISLCSKKYKIYSKNDFNDIYQKEIIKYKGIKHFKKQQLIFKQSKNMQKDILDQLYKNYFFRGDNYKKLQKNNLLTLKIFEKLRKNAKNN